MYYVYDLIDPRDGTTFYVGKGCRDRFDAHRRDAIKGRLGRKCDRIRDILASGNKYTYRIISKHQDELDAYEAEAQRVGEFGLDNLTNLIPGGFGGRVRNKGPFLWTERLVTLFRPRLRRILSIIAAGQRIYLGDYDISEITLGVVRMMRRDIGEDVFSRIVGVRFGSH